MTKSLYRTVAEQWAKNLETHGHRFAFFMDSPWDSYHDPMYQLLLDWQDEDGKSQEAWSEQSLDVKLLALAFAVAVLEAE
jgi:NAD(P)H-dependent FMN reductase